MLLTTIVSAVVHRRACLRDVIITNFYMAEWAVVLQPGCLYLTPFLHFPSFSAAVVVLTWSFSAVPFFVNNIFSKDLLGWAKMICVHNFSKIVHEMNEFGPNKVCPVYYHCLSFIQHHRVVVCEGFSIRFSPTKVQGFIEQFSGS